jgi:protein-tyrosine phosphatase
LIDTHSHILPGLDDGARDLEQALSIARLAVEDGINEMICTPHWVRGVFENTRAVVLSAVERLAKHLKENDIPLSLHPGSELRVDSDIAKKLRSLELLTLNDSGSYVLIEMPAEIIPPGMDNFLFSLQVEGVTPIIAHPERNGGLMRDPSRLYGWVESGVLAQLTAGSLLGSFGDTIRRFSVLLLEHGLIHLVASDAHGPKNRAPNLSAAFKSAEEIVGKVRTDEIFDLNPASIIRSETIIPFSPVPFGKSSSSRLKRLFSFLPAILEGVGLRQRISHT